MILLASHKTKFPDYLNFFKLEGKSSYWFPFIEIGKVKNCFDGSFDANNLGLEKKPLLLFFITFHH